MYYTVNPTFIQKNWDLQGIPKFLILDPKHILWVLVRTGEAVLTSTHNVCFERK